MFDILSDALNFYLNFPIESPFTTLDTFGGDLWWALKSDDGLLAPFHYTVNYFHGDLSFQN